MGARPRNLSGSLAATPPDVDYSRMEPDVGVRTTHTHTHTHTYIYIHIYIIYIYILYIYIYIYTTHTHATAARAWLVFTAQRSEAPLMIRLEDLGM